MGRAEGILKYRFLFNFLLVLASVAAGLLRTLWVGVLVVLLFAVSLILAWLTYRQNQIQPRSESLRTLLEAEVLPRLHEICVGAHPDGIPELRANVMLSRWRGINPWRNDFPVKPWERTLAIEASYVGPSAREYGNESQLEWRTDQGVVGDAMNERARRYGRHRGIPMPIHA